MALDPAAETGRAEIARVRRETRGLWLTAALFGVFVNLLMLTGPLYMLQIYDRVLSSRSEATLVALSALVVFLFIAMGFLDHARGRILARIGARLQVGLDRRVFTAALRHAADHPGDSVGQTAQRDLQAMQQYWSAPIAAALMDLPWVPIFITAIFIFHPYLGWLAVTGGIILVSLTLVNQRLGKASVLHSNAAAVAADRMADQMRDDAEIYRAMGMSAAAFQRWENARLDALNASMASTDISGAFTSSTRTLRLFLQSAMLGLGAWLVLQGALTAGAMIAGSIILGRALAPIEQAIGQWALLTRAQDGRDNLARLLSRQPPEPQRTALPRPRALLEVDGVSVLLPGHADPILRNITFRLEPGQALGIIGASGAGKSTLGRVLVGALRPVTGKIRLGGAELHHYDPEGLGGYIGYLPQNVALFDGTLAENIARLAPSPDATKVIAAARAAAAHDMIQRMRRNYDTVLGLGAPKLSGGQIQRVGLARALYGNPALLVLDEPNSNLDNEGSVALNSAIRQIKADGGSVVVIAHRPAAIQECDLLLMLEQGTRHAFGPRDDVLRSMVKNATDVVREKRPGGVS